MKKLIVSFLVAVFFFLGSAPSAYAATENDIITSLEAAQVPAHYVQQAQNYLRANDVSAQKADEIIGFINNAQKIVDASGAVNVGDLSQAEGQAIFKEISAAAAVIGMTVTMGSNEVTLFDANGNIVSTFPIKGVSGYMDGTSNASLSVNEVKQTGSSNLYLAGGIALLVAAAGSVVVSKKRAYASFEA